MSLQFSPHVHDFSLFLFCECLHFGFNGLQVFIGKSVLAASMSLYLWSTDDTNDILEWYPTIIVGVVWP